MASRAAVLITALPFAALFVGDSPFSPHAADKAAVAESGSAFNRAAIFAALGFSLPTALVCLERVVRILTRNWPVGLMVFWSGLTYAWASLPDLVPRRAFAYPLVYLTLAILAAASRSAADWLAPLTLAFALVTALNIVAVVAFPGISRSDIGEMGMFDDKNGAGTMAMPAIVVLATALAAGAGVPRLATRAMIGLAWVFLLATRPKTSIGVAASGWPA